jgi:hypothetical protein
MDNQWILDIDVTIKPIYGRQEGASIGHNLQKPGRPSHAYHNYWIATLRLCLDVEVHPGDQSSAGHGFAGLWALIERLPAERRPHLLSGDCAYGQEALLSEAEARKLYYLFRLRRTAKARELVAALERTTTTAWTEAGLGWQGCENCLRLQRWNRARRVVVLRRRFNDQCHPRARRCLVREQADHALLLNIPDAAACEPIIYEHQILVTSLPYEILTLATLYRERGVAETLRRAKEPVELVGVYQPAAQLLSARRAFGRVGLHLVDALSPPASTRSAPRGGEHRPRLLCGATRQNEHSGQRRLDVRLSHAEAPRLSELITKLARWLHGILHNAQQWSVAPRWRQIVARILQENFPVLGPEPPLATAPS